MLFSLGTEGQTPVCHHVRRADRLKHPGTQPTTKGGDQEAPKLQRKYSILQRAEYMGVPPTPQPHSPRPVPGWTQVTSNNRGSSSTDCFLWSPMAGLSSNCCPFFRSVYCAAPATLPGLGCLGLLLWGAPSSHQTGWTGSGSEAIGSGGFSITRDGSRKKQKTKNQTNQSNEGDKPGRLHPTP